MLGMGPHNKKKVTAGRSEGLQAHKAATKRQKKLLVPLDSTCNENDLNVLIEMSGEVTKEDDQAEDEAATEFDRENQEALAVLITAEGQLDVGPVVEADKRSRHQNRSLPNSPRQMVIGRTEDELRGKEVQIGLGAQLDLIEHDEMMNTQPLNPGITSAGIKDTMSYASAVRGRNISPAVEESGFMEHFRPPDDPNGPIAFDRSRIREIGTVGVKEGKPLLTFSAADTAMLAEQLGLALVGKFSHSIPAPNRIQNALGKINLTGKLSWKFLNVNHILISLTHTCDYVKLLSGVNELPIWFIEGCPMRVFKWTPKFHPSKETPLVAVWCRLPGLPAHLFTEDALFNIGSLIGKPLQVDRVTFNKEKIMFARICVEIDLTAPRHDTIFFDIDGDIREQNVIYERMPLFCSLCNHVGHSMSSCYANGRGIRPPRQVVVEEPWGKDVGSLGSDRREEESDRGAAGSVKERVSRFEGGYGRQGGGDMNRINVGMDSEGFQMVRGRGWIGRGGGTRPALRGFQRGGGRGGGRGRIGGVEGGDWYKRRREREEETSGLERQVEPGKGNSFEVLREEGEMDVEGERDRDKTGERDRDRTELEAPTVGIGEE